MNDSLKLLAAQTAYAEIYVADNSTAQSIPTGSTYSKVTAFSTNGASKSCIPDAANGQITIGKPGKYQVVVNFATKLGTTDVITDTAAFVNGVEQPNIHIRRRFSTSGYTFSVCFQGILSLASGDIVDVRSKHNNAGAVSATVEYANLNVIRIGA